MRFETIRQFAAVLAVLLILAAVPLDSQTLSGKNRVAGKVEFGSRASTTTVPSEFTDLYYYQLSRFSTFYTGTVLAGWDGTKRRPTCMGAELTAADALNPQATGYYASYITPMLDRFQDMGVNCVKVQIGYPNLYRPYYDWLWNGAGCAYNSSGGVQCAAVYANTVWNAKTLFWQTLRTDLTARSMKLNVQSAVQGSAASEQNVPSLAPFYDGITFTGSGGTENYQTGRATNVTNVITYAAPDYINVMSEPGHEYAQVAKSSGATAIAAMTSTAANCVNPNVFANCVYRQSVTSLLTTILTALAAIPINHTTTKVFAGVANGAYNWTNIAADEIALKASGLDGIDSHLHAITNTGTNDSILATVTLVDMAFAAGMRFGMNEESVDKSRPGAPGPTPSEQGGFGAANIYDRQWYTFWNPSATDYTTGVDEYFVKSILDMISWKKATGTVDYFIYSEPYEFFNALNYYSVSGCPPPSTSCAAGTLTSTNTLAAVAAISSGSTTTSILTNIGTYYKASIP